MTQNSSRFLYVTLSLPLILQKKLRPSRRWTGTHWSRQPSLSPPPLCLMSPCPLLLPCPLPPPLCPPLPPALPLPPPPPRAAAPLTPTPRPHPPRPPARSRRRRTRPRNCCTARCAKWPSTPCPSWRPTTKVCIYYQLKPALYEPNLVTNSNQLSMSQSCLPNETSSLWAKPGYQLKPALNEPNLVTNSNQLSMSQTCLPTQTSSLWAKPGYQHQTCSLWAKPGYQHQTSSLWAKPGYQLKPALHEPNSLTKSYLLQLSMGQTWLPTHVWASY